jgi:hypothetical protein
VTRASRILASLALVALSFILSACASNEAEDPNRVSTIPWNRPEKWEGQGPLGSMGMGSR